jgi:hypothetical protein
MKSRKRTLRTEIGLVEGEKMGGTGVDGGLSVDRPLGKGNTVRPDLQKETCQLEEGERHEENHGPSGRTPLQPGIPPAPSCPSYIPRRQKAEWSEGRC